MLDGKRFRFLFCYFSIIGFSWGRQTHEADKNEMDPSNGGDDRTTVAAAAATAVTAVATMTKKNTCTGAMNEGTFLLLHMIAIQVFFIDNIIG